MVQIQVFPIKNTAAVLAGVFVPLKDVVPGKLNLLFGQPIKTHQPYHSGYPDAKGNRPNRIIRVTVLGKMPPLAKVIGLEVPLAVPIHHLRVLFKEKG
jgi:hypothetical protein